MKRIAVALMAILVVFTSIPFSAYAKTSDMEIIVSLDGLPEKSYTPTYSSVGQITLMSESEALPSSFDARDYGWVTPLKRQEWGTCWSHAIISTIETYNISQGLDDINADYSEAHLVWFGNTKSTDVNNPTYGDGVTIAFNPDDYFIEGHYPENADKMGPYLVGASRQVATATLARWSGIANEVDFPSEIEAVPIDELHRYNTSSGFIIKSAEQINNITEAKTWVMNYGSADIVFKKYQTCSGPDGTVISWSFYDASENIADFHAVAIIGWDDNFPMREYYSWYETDLGAPELMPPADGAWLCKDSNGYFIWISYYDPTITEIVGYTAQPSNTYRENYTYNGTGYVAALSISNSASIANVFKTDEHEILSAVATYTCTVNQDLIVKVYTDLTDSYSDPTQGTLALEYQTTVPRTGYHTIELPQNIKLKPNTYFSVVIEYNNENGKAVFPAEYDYDFGENGFKYTYASNRGESFVFENGTWFYSEDAYQGMKNVYVQAFTNCDHQAETTTVPASCKETGYSETKCTQCKEILESTVIPKFEHNYQWVIETMPTATTDGSKKQICTVCNDETDLHTIPATGFESTNGMVVDYADNIIYGLDAGAVSLDTYTEFVTDGYEWIYTESENGFGTGTTATLKNGDKIIDEYTVIIFGDINGDGWYDGEDAFIVNLIAKGLLDKEDVGTAIWTAADCNHDGLVNEVDVDLLMGAGLRKNDIDQSATQAELVIQAAYIEYASIISQSADMPNYNTPIPNIDNTTKDLTTQFENETIEEYYIKVIIKSIFNFIKMIISSFCDIVIL